MSQSIKKKLNKKTRTQLIITALILLGIRIGSNIPVPFINRELIKAFLSQSQFSLLNLFAGGALEKMAIFALGVSPYITGSIVIQLLTVCIPRLKEIQDTDKDKHEKILFGTNIVLSLIVALSTTVYFGRVGYFKFDAIRTIVITLILTAGSVGLILLAKLIDKKGIGNGVSLILASGIIATLPGSIITLFKGLTHGKTTALVILISAALVLGIILITAFAVLLNESKRKVPITYSGKVISNKARSAQDTFIPLNANPAGVVPVIFSSQLLSLPLLIFHGEWTRYISQGNWFNFQEIKYTLGFILYAAMTVGFAFFYTSITVDPNQIAANLKRSGGMIPGIRPGKPTAEYLKKFLKPMILKGALALLAIQVVPMLISGIWGVNVGLGGTSILIIVGVVLETRNRLKAQKANTSYRSFIKS